MHPLPPSKYTSVLPRLAEVPFDTDFAGAVLRGHASGTVLVDDPQAPTLLVIRHRCGMSLLLGENDSPAFDSKLGDYLTNRHGTRTHPELLQAYPHYWAPRIRTMLVDRLVSGDALLKTGTAPEAIKVIGRDKVIEWTRLNYALRPDRFRGRRQRPLPDGMNIQRLGAAGFDGWEGASMPPRAFWDSVADFERRGVAFAVMRDHDIVSLAFSAWVMEGRLEIGIETHAACQGLGLAMHACSALIDHCLDAGLEPVWSCRQGNMGSERSALALGFEETRQIPYFALIC